MTTRVRALRGVCIGVDRHLMPGEFAELDPANAQFLTSIKAVELAPVVEEAPPKTFSKTESTAKVAVSKE